MQYPECVVESSCFDNSADVRNRFVPHLYDKIDTSTDGTCQMPDRCQILCSRCTNVASMPILQVISGKRDKSEVIWNRDRKITIVTPSTVLIVFTIANVYPFKLLISKNSNELS